MGDLEKRVEILELHVAELRKKAKRTAKVERFVAPTVEEVIEYARGQGWEKLFDPAYFVMSNDAVDWVHRGRKIVSWKAHYAAAVRLRQLNGNT